MDDKLNESIDRLKETKELLGKFSSKEDAIEYIINETGLSEEECFRAYDFIIKLDLDIK